MIDGVVPSWSLSCLLCTAALGLRLCPLIFDMTSASLTTAFHHLCVFPSPLCLPCVCCLPALNRSYAHAEDSDVQLSSSSSSSLSLLLATDNLSAAFTHGLDCMDAVEAGVQRLRSRVTTAEAATEDVRQRLHSATTGAGDVEAALRATTADRDSLRVSLDVLQSRLDATLEAKADVDNRCSRLQRQLADGQAETHEAQTALRTARAAVVTMEAEKAATERRLEVAKTEVQQFEVRVVGRVWGLEGGVGNWCRCAVWAF